MILIFFISISIYVVFWLVMEYYFHKDENESKKIGENLNTKCSIIICAYNEEKNIQKCLRSILEQEFDKNNVEIIVVDDGSSDNTFEYAKNVLEASGCQFQIICNEKNIGKKRSIEHAVNASDKESEWIVLRDADTYTKNFNWLKTLINCEVEGVDLIIAPVIFTADRFNFLSWFQFFENLALMHLTYSSWKMQHPILCNAANMAFKKRAFLELQPYKDNYNILSGDDIFLLQKFFKARKNIKAVFKSESTVYTEIPESWKQMLVQKYRWVSKASAVSNIFNLFSAFLMATTNLLLFFLFFYSFFYFAFALTLKIIVDLKVLYSVQKKLQLTAINSIKFLIAEVVYIPYVCALIFYYLYRTLKNDRRTFTKKN